MATRIATANGYIKNTGTKTATYRAILLARLVNPDGTLDPRQASVWSGPQTTLNPGETSAYMQIKSSGISVQAGGKIEAWIELDMVSPEFKPIIRKTDIWSWTEPAEQAVVYGTVEPGYLWYEGLLVDGVSAWDVIAGSGFAIPQNKQINLAPIWVNRGTGTMIGHIDVWVTWPDGHKAPVAGLVNQDMAADPGNGWSVQVEPFWSGQAGTYWVKATLLSNGVEINSNTFSLVTT